MTFDSCVFRQSLLSTTIKGNCLASGYDWTKEPRSRSTEPCDGDAEQYTFFVRLVDAMFVVALVPASRVTLCGVYSWSYSVILFLSDISIRKMQDAPPFLRA
jgi:hypothetical protein